MVCSKA